MFAGALTGRSAAKAGSAGMASVNASAKRTFLTSAPNSQFDAQTIFRFFLDESSNKKYIYEFCRACWNQTSTAAGNFERMKKARGRPRALTFALQGLLRNPCRRPGAWR